MYISEYKQDLEKFHGYFDFINTHISLEGRSAQVTVVLWDVYWEGSSQLREIHRWEDPRVNLEQTLPRNSHKGNQDTVVSFQEVLSGLWGENLLIWPSLSCCLVFCHKTPEPLPVSHMLQKSVASWISFLRFCIFQLLFLGCTVLSHMHMGIQSGRGVKTQQKGDCEGKQTSKVTVTVTRSKLWPLPATTTNRLKFQTTFQALLVVLSVWTQESMQGKCSVTAWRTKARGNGARLGEATFWCYKKLNSLSLRPPAKSPLKIRICHSS